MTFHLARGYVGTNKSVDQSSVKYSFGGSAMFYAGIDVAMDKILTVMLSLRYLPSRITATGLKLLRRFSDLVPRIPRR